MTIADELIKDKEIILAMNCSNSEHIILMAILEQKAELLAKCLNEELEWLNNRDADKHDLIECLKRVNFIESELKKLNEVLK